MAEIPDPDQPWKPNIATTIINRIAKEKLCDFSYTVHSKERMSERGLIMSDVLFVLRRGFVYEKPKASTLKGLYKYKVESKSPNSGARSLAVVAVADSTSCQLKVITIMWRDEV